MHRIFRGDLEKRNKFIKKILSKLISSRYLEDASAKRAVYKWLLIGLLIRFAFMPITVYYPDLLGVYWRSSLIAYRGMFSVGWSQILIHYLHVFFLLIFKPLMPYFDIILNDPKMGMGCTWGMFETFVHHPNVYRTLFLFKLPYLFFGLGCAFLLLRIPQDKERGLRAFRFWMLNPIVIFATYMAARFEVVPLFFILASLYYAKKNSLTKSLLCLGISIAIRWYPLILLPFFVVIFGKKLWERLKLAFWGIFPAGAMTALARLLYHNGGLGGVMQTYQSNYLLAMKFDLFFRDQVFVFVVAYAFLLLYTSFSTDHSFSHLWKTVLIVLLAFFTTSFFHVHYLMWLMPFLALQIAEDKKFTTLFVVQVLCFVVYSFQWEKNFAGWLFAPIDPYYFISLRSPFKIIDQYYSAVRFIGIFRSIFSGVCLSMIYLIFREFTWRERREKR